MTTSAALPSTTARGWPVTARLAAGLPVAPPRVEGTIVAAVLLAGLSYVWLAFAERLPADRTSGH
jgi:hypothetical protein